MLGKIQINNKWFLCQLENNQIYILKANCEKPMVALADEDFLPESMFKVYTEKGVYFFDKNFVKEQKCCSEYYYSIIEYTKCFSSNYEPRGSACYLGKCKKVSFKGGVLIPMMQNFEKRKYKLKYGLNEIAISFNKCKRDNDQYCNLEFGRLMLEGKSSVKEYSIDVNIETEDLCVIYGIINKMYDFIRLINLDVAPCLSKIEIEMTNLTLEYWDNRVNFDCQQVKKYNYIYNIRNRINNILEFVFNHEYKYDFFLLLDKDEIGFQDTNILAEAIESISPEYDIHLDDEIAKDIKKYKILKDEIKKTIKLFEDDKGKIDKDKKNFILSLIEISRFRQKVEFLLRCCNNFAKVYTRYAYLTDEQILDISRDIQTERNNIHGTNKHINRDKFIYEVQYVMLGLLIYIFKSAGCSDSEIFNLCNHIFCARIQQIKH